MGTRGFLQFIFKYFYYSAHFLLFTLKKTTLQVLCSSSIITPPYHMPTVSSRDPWNKFNFGNYLEHGSWTQVLWTLLLSIFSFSSWFHCSSPTCQVGNHSFNKCPQWACMPCWPRSPGRSVNPSNFAPFHSHAQSPKCRPWPQSCQLCYTRQEFSFMRAKNEISEY